MRHIIEELGELHLWKLAIKPGKPLLFGNISDTPVIGLPGNPVSTFVTFSLYARPFILKMQGCAEHEYARRSYSVQSGFSHKTATRREYLRARLEKNNKGILIATLHPNQSSGVLVSTTWADGLICIPEESNVKTGDGVEFLSFGEMG